jgi:hypothetical protein
LDYWEKNEKSCQTAISKLQQISFAIEKLRITRGKEALVYRPTINTPLNYLIQDLTFDFKDGTNEKPTCYHNDIEEKYQGKFFDFVVFILSRFAPNSYESELALGERIKRALAMGYK